MLGRVVAVSLGLFLSSSTLFSQCDFAPRYSGQFRSSLLDLSIDANDLWAATSYGVALYDRAVTPPRLIESTALPGITRVVRAAGGTAYAGSGSLVFVLRKSGDGISILRSVEAGALINDLLLIPGYLFVATSNGLVQFNVGDSSNPVRTSAQFATSANTTGLAAQGFLLYVADSDSTVEVFSIADPASPQKTASLNSLPRSESVAVAPGRVYVTDGQSTDIFLTSGSVLTNVATVPFGSTSFATLSGEVAFAAGSDRRVRAVDFALAGNPVRLFEADIAATGGTVNRIGALQVADGRLYVAAGDAGLVVYDISGFTSPYAVQAIGSSGGTTTVVSAGNRFYAAKATGGFVEYSRNSTGLITLSRTWDVTRVGAVHEVTSNGFILTSSDRTLIYSTLNSLTPTSISLATFRRAITSAVISGTVAYVVLEDRSLWSADMAQLSPNPQLIATPGVNPTAIARSNSSFAIADIRDDRTTRVAFYTGPTFTNPRFASVDGSATSGLSLSGTTAAVFTFRGISIIDFATSTPSIALLQDSNTNLVRSLSLRGGTLVTLEEQSVSVWNLTTKRRTRQIALPAEGVAVHVSEGTNYADVATNDGVAAVAYTSTSQLPSLRSGISANRYYKDAAAVADRLYLFDGQVIDAFSLAFGAAPHHLTAIRVPGIVDFAVSLDNVFVLTSSGLLLSFSRDGFLLNQTTLSEGASTEVLGIEAVGGAPWVAISRGCPNACAKETLVFDRRSLVSTSRLSGGVTDAVTAGSRAYAIFELPNEIRVLDIADPLHPAPLVNRATEGARVPVSIASANGIIYVIGEQLYSYSESDLNNIGTQLEPYESDVMSAVAYVDQRVVVEGSCALVSGREFSPQFFATFSPAQWSALSAIPVPATVKAIAATPGRLVVLTDYSVEVLSTVPPAPFPRRRAVR